MLTTLRTSAALVLSLAFVPAVPHAHAAGSMTILMVPHCTEQSECPEYDIFDAEHFTTGQLAAGDILDIDILVRGSDYARVRSVKSWITYDPKILEARSVELTSEVPSPTPGEQNIDTTRGIVKIGGSTTSGFSSPDTRVARVTFRVLETTSNTELSFDGYNESGVGNTAVNAENSDSPTETGGLPPPPCFDSILGCSGTTTPLLSGAPAKLIVKLVSATEEPSGSSSSSSASSDTGNSDVPLTDQQMSSSESTTTPSSLTGQGSTFGILQVQDVRVTTRDTVIFLGWQALKSSELAGYNVYYGTVSGRYIQRRSLPATSTSLVLRDLQPGMTYYLAVRAVNAQEQESVFSQEVSVTVGDPETATSPMTTLPPDSGAVAGNPIETRGGTTIKGETGSASIVLWIIVSSAIIGTTFAFRRQLALASHVA